MQLPSKEIIELNQIKKEERECITSLCKKLNIPSVQIKQVIRHLEKNNFLEWLENENKISEYPININSGLKLIEMIKEQSRLTQQLKK